MKNFFALMMLSNGVPMIVAGDEFANTQHGNNNPYNQDNETTWLDWDRLTTNRELFDFVKGMIALRKSRRSIARSRFWRDDVQWFGTTGAPDLSAAVTHPGLAPVRGDLRRGRPVRDGQRLLGATWSSPSRCPESWRVLVDTGATHTARPGSSRPRRLRTARCVVQARSIVVLSGRPA